MSNPKFADKEEGVMVNPRIKNAAQLAVRGGGIGKLPVEIPDYPGMYVVEGESAELAAITFFTEEEKRYTVGPLKKP